MSAQKSKIKHFSTALTRPSLRKVRILVDEIVRKFHPQRVILFGSYAGGRPTGNSDVDLLIVMKTRRRSPEQAVAIRQAVDFPFPVDLLVRTPEQVQERLRLGDNFMREIVSRGKVLYEADHG